jgi:hypothetical protein
MIFSTSIPNTDSNSSSLEVTNQHQSPTPTTSAKQNDSTAQVLFNITNEIASHAVSSTVQSLPLIGGFFKNYNQFSAQIMTRSPLNMH